MWQGMCLLTVILGAQDGGDAPEAIKIQPTPSVMPAEIVAGYRENVAKFNRVRVTWQSVSCVLPGWLEWRRALVKQMEDELREAQQQRQLDDAQKKRCEAYVRNLKSECDHVFEEFWNLQDFWTDGKRIQVREPAASIHESAEAARWRFSDAPLTPETLRTTYRHYRIESFDPDRTERLWLWTGWDTSSAYDARFGNAAPQGGTVYITKGTSVGERDAAFRFPPLLRRPHPKSESVVHIVDRFFDFPPSELRVLGITQLGDASVYVVEHRRDREPWDGAGQAGVQVATFTRAFIAPDRGYLPVRIETWDARLDHGKLVDRQPPPYQVLECLEVKDVPGGGFYPTKGMLKSWWTHPEDMPCSQSLTPEAFLRRPLGRTFLTREGRWEVQQITTDPAMPGTMFAMEFPKGTYCYNKITGREYQVGVRHSVLESLWRSLTVSLIEAIEYRTTTIIRNIEGAFAPPGEQAAVGW
jgi:hypothetical protein